MGRNLMFGAVAVALLVALTGIVGVAIDQSPGAGELEPFAQDTTTEQAGNESTGGTASVAFDDQSSNGTAVVVSEANLSEGGFVVLYSQGGTVLGNSSYLEPGTTENATVEFDTPLNGSQVVVAVPHMDTNDNQTFDFDAGAAQAAATTIEEGGDVSTTDVTDGPYTENELPVSSVAFVTVEDGGNATDTADRPALGR